MATLSEKKQAIEAWREHCKQIAALTDTSLMAPESKTDRKKRIASLQRDYAAFCEYYFRTSCSSRIRPPARCCAPSTMRRSTTWQHAR